MHGLADDGFVFDLVAGAESGDPLAVVAFADTLGDERQGAFHIAHDRHVGRDDLADLRGVDLQVDHLGVGAEMRGIPRHAVVETHAHGHEQVALLVLDVGTVVAVHAQHAHVLRMVGRQGRETQQGRGGGHAALVEQRPQLGFGVAQDDALTHHDQRTAGLVDQPCGFGDAFRVGCGRGEVTADRGDFFVAERSCSALCVLGDVDHDGTQTARAGDVEGLGDGRGNVLGALDLAVPFGDGLRDADEIGLLKGVGAQQRGADLSGDEHQRRGVHQRVGQPRHGVRGAGTRGHQTDPDAAADAGIALCGVHGALLVTYEDVAQAVAVVVKRVVDGDDRASGIAENGFDALLEK